MSEFIGEVKMFAGNFAPRAWAFCDGQILSTREHMALFSILGNAYGGDGRMTFALPNLTGRVPVGAGRGRSTTFNPKVGEKGGNPSTQIMTDNLPAHHHDIIAKNAKANLARTDSTDGVNPEANVKVADTDGDNVKAKNNAIGFKATDTSGDQVKIYKKNPVFTNGNMLAGVELQGEAGVEGQTEDTGDSMPLETMPPYLGIHFIICLYGMYPPRK